MKKWKLFDGTSYYLSDVPGLYGGHYKTKIYGTLECRSANSAIKRGGYTSYRVFFE